MVDRHRRQTGTLERAIEPPARPTRKAAEQDDFDVHRWFERYTATHRTAGTDPLRGVPFN